MITDQELKRVRKYGDKITILQEGDVAPELMREIQDEFEKRYKSDQVIKQLADKITDGTATHLETQAYAVKIGELSSEALSAVLTTERLPDGRLYWNIAERTILPTMRANHDLVNAAAEEVEKELRKRAKIGIKPVRGALDLDRVRAIMEKACSTERFEDHADVLGEPIKNATQSMADDFMRANAEALKKWGLRPKITRIVVGNCCDWCAAMAGTYDYGEEPRPEFYRRHDRCRCAVIYDPGTGYIQNSHTKKWRRKTN